MKCREDTVKRREYSITKASHCDVQCCSEDLCNSGTTMSKARGLSVGFVDVMTFVAVSLIVILGADWSREYHSLGLPCPEFSWYSNDKHSSYFIQPPTDRLKNHQMVIKQNSCELNCENSKKRERLEIAREKTLSSLFTAPSLLGASSLDKSPRDFLALSMEILGDDRLFVF